MSRSDAEERTRQRNIRDAQEKRREMERHQALAKHAEIVTEAVEDGHPLWADVIEPWLEQVVETFEKSEAWIAPTTPAPGEVPFEQRRGYARFAVDLKQYILSLVGSHDKHMAEAERLGKMLEAARQSGLIPPETT